MSSTVVLVSDLHCNSRVGLSPPTVNLDNGGTYRASKPQRWLWSRFLAFRDEAGEIRERNGGRLILILNGELADDNHHSKFELVDINPKTMMATAVEALRPLLELVREGDAIYVTRGTEAHSGRGAWMDDRIAADIGAVAADEGVASFYHLLLNIDGVRFNIAHHPPIGPGRLPWTSPTYATRLASHAYMSALMAGEQPPHLYVRGHYHVPGDSYDAYPPRPPASAPARRSRI